MNVTHITSMQNPKVKAAAALRERREREQTGLTLLEGYRELTRAFDFGLKLQEVFFTPSLFLGSNELPLLEKLAEAGIKLYEVPQMVLEKIAYRDRPEGLIATAQIPAHRLEDFPCPQKPGLYLIAENVEKPGNLGSILRSADAAGATGLILTDPRTDLYNPNTIRASTGALFALPIAVTDNDSALAWLRKNKIQILAATPHTNHVFTQIDLTVPVAIAVGAEQYGLSDFWMNQADLQVVIPMLGKIDSLNVSTAATLLLYECARQREFKPSN